MLRMKQQCIIRINYDNSQKQNRNNRTVEIGARINAIVVNGVDIALGFNSQADYE